MMVLIQIPDPQKLSLDEKLDIQLSYVEVLELLFGSRRELDKLSFTCHELVSHLDLQTTKHKYSRIYPSTHTSKQSPASRENTLNTRGERIKLVCDKDMHEVRSTRFLLVLCKQ